MIYSHTADEANYNTCAAPGCRERTGKRYKPADVNDALGGFWYTFACSESHAESGRYLQEQTLPRAARVRGNGRRA